MAVELDEGQRIANAIGKHKAAILQNHGLITVGGTVDEAVWWFITMERSCQVQLVAEAALKGGETLKLISPQAAAQAYKITGSSFAGWFQFQPLYARIVKEQPDLLERGARLSVAAREPGAGLDERRTARAGVRLRRGNRLASLAMRRRRAAGLDNDGELLSGDGGQQRHYRRDEIRPGSEEVRGQPGDLSAGLRQAEVVAAVAASLYALAGVRRFAALGLAARRFFRFTRFGRLTPAAMRTKECGMRSVLIAALAGLAVAATRPARKTPGWPPR